MTRKISSLRTQRDQRCDHLPGQGELDGYSRVLLVIRFIRCFRSPDLPLSRDWRAFGSRPTSSC
jgi:hypothetical protein